MIYVLILRQIACDSTEAIIVGESVKAVAAKLEQEEHITSSKFNQHFQTALEEGLTDALMDELGSFFVCFGGLFCFSLIFAHVLGQSTI